MTDSCTKMKFNFDLKISDFSKENCFENMIEEPASPPACDVAEGPPLIFSQSIEDIASEVVDENRIFENVTKSSTNNSNIPKVVELVERSSIGSLIPVTVSEISQDPVPYPYQSPSTLHMSGGMVSTEVTLHMASVPTSVITTNKHIETKLTQDQGIDKILKYFMTDLSKETNSPVMRHRPDIFSEMTPNLPLDLSVAKIPEGSKAGPTKTVNGEDKLDNRKRKRDHISNHENEMQGLKKPLKVSRIEVEGSKLKKKETKNNPKQDKEICKSNKDTIGSQFSGNVQVDNNNAGSVQEKTLIKNCQRLNNFDCRLVLPRGKEEKAKIVFKNGLYVEIDRKMFQTLEQNICKTKPECHKNPKKTAKQSCKLRTGTSQKYAEKQNSIEAPVESKTQAVENCDTKPKDMPMIILEDDEEILRKESLKQPIQIQANSNNLTPPPTPPPSSSPNFFLPNSTSDNLVVFPLSISPALSPSSPSHNFPTPPPSNPASPPRTAQAAIYCQQAILLCSM